MSEKGKANPEVQPKAERRRFSADAPARLRRYSPRCAGCPTRRRAAIPNCLHCLAAPARRTDCEPSAPSFPDSDSQSPHSAPSPAASRAKIAPSSAAMPVCPQLRHPNDVPDSNCAPMSNAAPNPAPIPAPPAAASAYATSGISLPA